LGWKWPSSPAADPWTSFLYPSILDALQDGVVVYDEQERIVYCNPAAMAILGVGEDELATGRRTWEPLGTDGLPLPADRRPVAITAATGEPCRGVDVGLRRADGSVACRRGAGG
jgi:PAS domain S-box-containing protein